MHVIEIWVKGELYFLETLRLLRCIKKSRRFILMWYSGLDVSESSQMFEMTPKKLYPSQCLGKGDQDLSKEMEHKKAPCKSIKPGDIIITPGSYLAFFSVFLVQNLSGSILISASELLLRLMLNGQHATIVVDVQGCSHQNCIYGLFQSIKFILVGFIIFFFWGIVLTSLGPIFCDQPSDYLVDRKMFLFLCWSLSYPSVFVIHNLYFSVMTVCSKLLNLQCKAITELEL